MSRRLVQFISPPLHYSSDFLCFDMYLLVTQGLLVTLDFLAIYMQPFLSCITRSFVSGGVHFDKTSENTK